MKQVSLFTLKIGVAVASFVTYLALMVTEMVTSKPLISDAKTLLVFSFGTFTGMISHLMTQGAPKEQSSVESKPTV